MDGIIIINKTKGCTSHDIVYKIKKMLNEKVGHTGTLDPMAEGVLPILIGKGTLLSKYLINHDKKYIVELQLGKKTDTADSEGKIIEEQQVNERFLTNENITNILHTFIGKQKPQNLVHICLNNEAHESVGGMPTGCVGLSYAEVAKTVGYEETYMVDSLQGLKDTLENVKEKRKLIFIEIKVSMDSRKDLGRPKETAEENKNNFMKYHGVM